MSLPAGISSLSRYLFYNKISVDAHRVALDGAERGHGAWFESRYIATILRRHSQR